MLGYCVLLIAYLALSSFARLCRHYTYPRGLPNPWNHQVEGWTGHTVYPYLFPDTTHFASYLARRGVKLMFNHHHAAGIMFHEAVYPSMAAAVGVDPKNGKTVEFDIANLTWADAYFREVIKPLEDVGVNLDWEDFQQQPVVRGCIQLDICASTAAPRHHIRLRGSPAGSALSTVRQSQAARAQPFRALCCSFSPFFPCRLACLC